MKKETVSYYCDVCGKQVKKDELHPYRIPVKYYYDRETTTTDTSIEICEECRQALKKAISENFAQIAEVWCGGTEVEKVVYLDQFDKSK